MSKRLDFRCTRALRLLRALVEGRDEVLDRDDAQIRTYGLSPAEFDGLVTLGVLQPMRMCDLARESLLTKSHATQVVKALECRELARRERSPDSEREVLASLTPAGQALFQRVYPEHYHWLATLFDRRLEPEEQERLATLLRKLADDG